MKEVDGCVGGDVGDDDDGVGRVVDIVVEGGDDGELRSVGDVDNDDVVDEIDDDEDIVVVDDDDDVVDCDNDSVNDNNFDDDVVGVVNMGGFVSILGTVTGKLAKGDTRWIQSVRICCCWWWVRTRTPVCGSWRTIGRGGRPKRRLTVSLTPIARRRCWYSRDRQMTPTNDRT